MAMQQQWQDRLYDIYLNAFWAGVDGTLSLPVQELDQAQAWHREGATGEPPQTLVRAAQNSQIAAMTNTLQALSQRSDTQHSSYNDSGYRVSEINWQAITLYNAPPNRLESAQKSQWRVASLDVATASAAALLILRPDGSRDGARFTGPDVLAHIAELLKALTPLMAEDCRAIDDPMLAEKYENLLGDVRMHIHKLQHLQNTARRV